MTHVKNFAMFKWTGDEISTPLDTSWFFSWDKERNTVPLKDMVQYEEDWIGLRTLYESDRLFFYKGRGGHMNMELKFMEKYLAPLLLEETPAPSRY